MRCFKKPRYAKHSQFLKIIYKIRQLQDSTIVLVCKVLSCAVIWTCALIYFLKSVDPVRLYGPGLLLGTQEYVRT